MADAKRCVIEHPGILRLAKHPSLNLKHVIIPGETVIDIKSGANHSAILCYSGRVYMLGNQIGLGAELCEETINTNEPTLVDTLFIYHIVQISCGENFTMFLEKKGGLFVLGQNNNGQLGIGSRIDAAFPVQVSDIPSIRKISAGGQHSAALCVAGKVWVAGDNSQDQLGLIGNTTTQTTFTCIPGINGRFKDISCGSFHTAILSELGVLYLTGMKTTSDLLGFGTASVVDGFKPILTAITTMACGGGHTIAVTEGGEFWAWGLNNCGQLGTRDRVNRLVPTQMVIMTRDKNAKVIARGNCTALLTDKGNLFVCGEGTYGGVDNAPIVCPTQVTKSPVLAVDQLSFADNYTLLLAIYQPSKALETIDTWERIMLQSLECACLKIMSPPIKMCAKGHNFCDTCCTTNPNCSICHEPFTATRNITLESICLVTLLPCIYCLQRIPAYRLDTHRKECPERKPPDHNWSACAINLLPPPSGSPIKCKWNNQPFQFVHKNTGEVLLMDIVGAHNEVFNLHRKYEKNSNVFMTAMRYTGPPEDVYKYKLQITYNAGDNSPDVIAIRNICPSNVESIEDIFKATDCVYIHQDLGLSLSEGRSFCEATVVLVE